MNNSIISEIYSAYLNDEFDEIQPLRTDDLQIEYEKLGDFEKKHNISFEECADFETNILNEFTYISEKKGFTNGFKLAVQLIFEACNKTVERA